MAVEITIEINKMHKTFLPSFKTCTETGLFG